jgi:hypothetical protein
MQPVGLRVVLSRLSNKGNSLSVNGPVGWMMLLILTPLLIGLFEVNGKRLLIHSEVQLRSALCAMLYGKVLRSFIALFSCNLLLSFAYLSL